MTKRILCCMNQQTGGMCSVWLSSHEQPACGRDQLTHFEEREVTWGGPNLSEDQKHDAVSSGSGGTIRAGCCEQTIHTGSEKLNTSVYKEKTVMKDELFLVLQALLHTNTSTLPTHLTHMSSWKMQCSWNPETSASVLEHLTKWHHSQEWKKKGFKCVVQEDSREGAIRAADKQAGENRRRPEKMTSDKSSSESTVSRCVPVFIYVYAISSVSGVRPSTYAMKTTAERAFWPTVFLSQRGERFITTFWI